MRFHEITGLVERFGRKSANPSIGETTKPRRSGRQFASEAGDRGRSVRAPEADDARPKSRLAGQHGSVTSLAGKKTRADGGSTWKGTAYRLAANNVDAFIETAFSPGTTAEQINWDRDVFYPGTSISVLVGHP